MGNFNSNDGSLSSSDQKNVPLRHFQRAAVLHHYKDAIFVVDYHAIVQWVYCRSQIKNKKSSAKAKWVDHMESERSKNSVEYVAHLKNLDSSIIDLIPLQNAATRSVNTPTSCLTPNTNRSTYTDTAAFDWDVNNSAVFPDILAPSYIAVQNNTNSFTDLQSPIPPSVTSVNTAVSGTSQQISQRQRQFVRTCLVILRQSRSIPQRSSTGGGVELVFESRVEKPSTGKEAWQLLLRRAQEEYITAKRSGLGTMFNPSPIDPVFLCVLAILLMQDESFFTEEIAANEAVHSMLYTFLSQLESWYHLDRDSGQRLSQQEQELCAMLSVELLQRHPDLASRLSAPWETSTLTARESNNNDRSSGMMALGSSSTAGQVAPIASPPPLPDGDMDMFVAESRPGPLSPRELYSSNVEARYLSTEARDLRFYNAPLSQDNAGDLLHVNDETPQSPHLIMKSANINDNLRKLRPRYLGKQFSTEIGIDGLSLEVDMDAPSISYPVRMDEDKNMGYVVNVDQNSSSHNRMGSFGASEDFSSRSTHKRSASVIWKHRNMHALQEELAYNQSCGTMRFNTMEEGVRALVTGGVAKLDEPPSLVDQDIYIDTTYEVQPHICDSDSEEDNLEEYTSFLQDTHGLPGRSGANSVSSATLTYPWDATLLNYKKMVRESRQSRKRGDRDSIELDGPRSSAGQAQKETFNNLDDIPTVHEPAQQLQRPSLFSCGSMPKSRSEGPSKSIGSQKSQSTPQHTTSQSMHIPRSVSPISYLDYPSNAAFLGNLPNSFVDDMYHLGGPSRAESVKYDESIPSNREHLTQREERSTQRHSANNSNRSSSRSTLMRPPGRSVSHSSTLATNSGVNGSSSRRQGTQKSQWRDFIHPTLHLTSSKTTEGVAVQIREYSQLQFQVYTKRRRSRSMSESNMYNLVFDLHTLSVNEGALLFEFEILKFCLKMLDRIETALFVNGRTSGQSSAGATSSTNQSARSLSSTSSFKEPEDPYRPLKTACRQAIRAFYTWCMNQFRVEHNARKSASVSTVRLLAKEVWDKVAPSADCRISEVHFMYYFPDILEHQFPTARFTVAAKQVFLDIECLQLDDDTL